MKCFTVLCALITASCGCTSKIESGYHGIKWGTDVKTVKEKYPHLGKQPYCDLGYKDKVAGYKCVVCYTFEQNKLVDVSVFFSENYPIETEKVAEYRQVEKMLAEKYGTPSSEHKTEIELVMSDSEIAQALAVRGKYLKHIRETEQSRVGHVMMAQAGRIHHLVEYSDRTAGAKKGDGL